MDVLSRRQFLLFNAGAGALFLSGDVMSEAQNLVSATASVDHLLLGAADLDKGMEWVEKRTGVRAMIGGSHPGRGTRNALLSLGRRQYLEIIAPDPAQAAANTRIDVRQLVEPRLIGWAAATNDIEALAKRVREAGQHVLDPRDGARARPDGTMLRWKTLAIQNALSQEIVDPIPFFIEWAAGSVHPSQDSPRGCELQSLEIEASDPAAVGELLTSIGIDGSVRQARTTSLRATLVTPTGKIELS